MSYLVLNPISEPAFTYQEMLQAMNNINALHDARADELAQLDINSAVWENLADAEKDPIAYNTLKRYRQALEMYAHDLAAHGLSSNLKRELGKIKARYAKDILPLEEAYKKRLELAKEQRNARLNDKSLMFERDMADTSLDIFVENPNYDWGKSISKEELKARVMLEALALKGKYMSELGELTSFGLPYLYLRTTKTGIPLELLEDWNKHPENRDPFLVNMVNSVLESSGLGQWATARQWQEAFDYAATGLYAGVGEDKIDYFTDNYNMLLGVHNATNPPDLPENEITKLIIDPLYTEKEISDTALAKDLLAKNYVTYDPKTDSYQINNAGEHILLGDETKYYNVPMGQWGVMSYKMPSTLKTNMHKFIKDNLGLEVDDLITGNTFEDSRKGISPKFTKEGLKKFSDAYKKYLKGISEQKYDAYRENQYTLNFNHERGKAFKDYLVAVGPLKGYDNVKFYKDGIKSTGKKLTSADLKGYYVKSATASKLGLVIKLVKDGADSYTIQFPYTARDNLNVATILNSIEQASKYSLILNNSKGLMPKLIEQNGHYIEALDNDGNVIFEEDILINPEIKAHYEKFHNDALKNIETRLDALYVD